MGTFFSRCVSLAGKRQGRSSMGLFELYNWRPTVLHERGFLSFHSGHSLYSFVVLHGVTVRCLSLRFSCLSSTSTVSKLIPLVLWISDVRNERIKIKELYMYILHRI